MVLTCFTDVFCEIFSFVFEFYRYDGCMELATQYYKKICKLEGLLGKAIFGVEKLEKENAKLKKQIMELEIRNAQLEDMYFGGGKKGGGSEGEDVHVEKLHSEKRIGFMTRAKSSYRRAVPKDEEVTEIKKYTLSACPSCKGELGYEKTLTRYVEDIPFPVKKIVTKEEVGVYYCKACGRKHYAKEMNLQGSEVVLGKNVKQFILYGIYIQHLTFGKIQSFLNDVYGLQISDGEIQNILAESAVKLEPEAIAIRRRIRESSSILMDESGWQMNAMKHYLWVMVPVIGPEISIEIRDTRGKGVAELMIGPDFKGVLITDFYAVYKRLVKLHGVCWVHLLRDFYNLATNPSVPKKYRSLTRKRYESLAKLYSDLKEILESPFSLKERRKKYKIFRKKLRLFAKQIPKSCPLKKLLTLKKRIKDYEKELMICIIKENVPPNSNGVEQAIRHSVIKRKISFGSRSENGCKIFAINMSVLLTYWRNSKQTFFSSLAKALG